MNGGLIYMRINLGRENGLIISHSWLLVGLILGLLSQELLIFIRWNPRQFQFTHRLRYPW